VPVNAASRLPSLRRRLTGLTMALAAVALMAGPMVLPAQAQGVASSVVTSANLSADGTLKVTQTITFTGAPPATLEQRIQTRQNLLGDRQYAQTLSAISATVAGAAVTPDVDEDDENITQLSVPTNGATEVTIGYTVVGAVINIENGVALRWPLLQGLNVQVNSFTGTVAIPGQFSYIRCTAGSPNSTTPCAFAAAGTEDAHTPTFRDGPRGEREVVVADIGFPAGTVSANETIIEEWTIGRAFSVDPLPLGLALGLLLLGALGLLAMHRRAGSDAKTSGELHKAAEFVPVGPGLTEFRPVSDLRPGQIGTIVDERVDPIDVTATVLDLAVRGHLHIEELPRSSPFARTDWLLTRRSGSDALRPFEKALLDGLAPDAGSVKVSELPGRIHDSIGSVQNALYDEVVEQGWYERRPDATRSRWTRLAGTALVVAIAITVLLAAFTSFGLLGLALIALSLGLLFVAQEMPSRTHKGAALLNGLGALRSDLLSHPTNQMPPGRELEELSEVLPYAVVLGGVDRWLDAVSTADSDDTADSTDLSWYHGPADWHLRDLPDSLRNFITTTSGSLFTR
jgi:hypothetical protein